MKIISVFFSPSDLDFRREVLPRVRRRPSVPTRRRFSRRTGATCRRPGERGYKTFDDRKLRFFIIC
jgi:hypothetical protein